jgi:hypothetical protein
MLCNVSCSRLLKKGEIRMTHNCGYAAASCGHLHVKYCPCCGKVYCEDCGQTWSKDWFTYYPTQPYTITWASQYGGTGNYTSDKTNKAETVMNVNGGCEHPKIISRY